jgi:hypothetical protein
MEDSRVDSFGLAHVKQEGAPAHPDDVYIHCGCAKCEARWQFQLSKYEEFMATQKKPMPMPKGPMPPKDMPHKGKGGKKKPC